MRRSSPAAAWTVLVVMVPILAVTTAAGEWPQWRGPGRSGTAATGVELRTSLPEGGLVPRWISAETFVTGGGWSSPIVAAGRVHVYVHRQRLKPGANPPPPQYPNLPDDKKAALSPQELDAYEELRVEEQMTRLREFYEHADVMHALDAASGRTLWTHERPSGPTRWRQSSTPACAEGRLFYLGADRAMVCLDAGDGSVRWTTPLPFDPDGDEPAVSSPVVVDGLVVVGAGRLVAYEATTGRVAWQGDRDHTRGVYSSPTVWRTGTQAFVLAHGGKGRTICLAAPSGREVWQVETFADRSSPTVVGDLLFTYGGSRKGGLRCYRLSTSGAEEIWKNQQFADSGSSPAVAAGLLFVQTNRGLACVDATTGETRWLEPVAATDPRYTSPVVAGTSMVFAVEGVLCLAVDAAGPKTLFDACMLADGRLVPRADVRKRLGLDELERSPGGQQQAAALWHKEVVGSGPLRCVTPAVADGMLFLRTSNRIVCYDLTRP